MQTYGMADAAETPAAGQGAAAEEQAAVGVDTAAASTPRPEGGAQDAPDDAQASNPLLLGQAEDKQAAPGFFARIKSMAAQNKFVSSAVTQLTQVQRERAEVAEAERDRAVRERDEARDAAAELRYERDETRTIACIILAAMICTSTLSQWVSWLCAIVAAFGVTRLVREHSDSIIAAGQMLTQRSERAGGTRGAKPRAPMQEESCAAEKRASAEATPVEAAGECDMKQRTGSPQKSGKAALRKSLSRREEGVGDFLRNFVPAALITTIIVLAVDTFVLGEGLRPLLPF